MNQLSAIEPAVSQGQVASHVVHPLVVEQTAQGYRIAGRHYQFMFSQQAGAITQVHVFGGTDCASRNTSQAVDLLPEDARVGLNWKLPVVHCELVSQSDSQAVIEVVQADEAWRLMSTYTFYRKGYVECTFELCALQDQAPLPFSQIGVTLSKDAIQGECEFKNTSNDPKLRQSVRGMSVNFSVDGRPVTHSADLLLEYTGLDMTGKPMFRFHEQDEQAHHLGWGLTRTWQYPCPQGYTYQNRWCFSVTAFDNSPNPVRGQRICQWASVAPAFPDQATLEELAEYGCSILILHMPSFKHIDGCEPVDDAQMRQTVARAHELGMKVMVYCQPYLISQAAEYHAKYVRQRTECLGIWISGSDAQTCFYKADNAWDADELCLRCREAFDYMCKAPVDCLEQYDLDGLYVDWAWPAQGLCSDPAHEHDAGLFNYHDYLGVLRAWRTAIGPGRLMIGHGGGFIVGSDMIEGFDACLTGEAQEKVTPSVVGHQFGTAATLWTFQRRKEDVFRSRQTVEQLIEQAVTPHLGVGVTGSAILATMDPGYFSALLPVWQMWRAFPVDRARVYFESMTPGYVSRDNDEVVYSLYVTEQGQALLILANAGGPRCDDAPAIGVNVQLNLDALGLSDHLRCWRIKGDRYETVRVQEVPAVQAGRLTVAELGLHECVAFVLSPDQPPAELEALQEHLAGRFARLTNLGQARLDRLTAMDQQLDDYAKLPNASVFFSYRQFMAGRVAE